ncbi:MAG TPA: isoprenylcysteine carboxylmethyltransferase family protein [Caulobacteraceae bacterium]|nr:isoprenylcysteine carboxylmethyltransferase family protein [Caulobacteraceae bacterium]
MNLLARTFFGFGFLFVVMGLAVFGAAGTTAVWRGWAFLGVFAGCSGLITAWLWRHDKALLERRVRAGPGAERDPAQNLIQALAGVAFLGSLVAPGLDYRFHGASLPTWVAIFGDALIALGFYIVFRTFRVNSFASGVVERMDDQTLVDTGPYRLVRHPMYAGALLMFVAMPFALGSWWGLAVIPLILGALIWRLIAEERFLVEHLAGYGEYRGRVRWRLAPGLW